MSFLKNPFSVLHYADGENNDGETEKNPVVQGKNDNRQKQKQFSDQSRMTSVPPRLVGNGAPTQIYNGQSNGGKDNNNNNNGQNEINNQYGYKQGNGYGNLNDQSPPPPDGDHSSEGGWNFVREKRGGTLRRRIGSLKNNSSVGKLMNEVKVEKIFPKPKQSVKNTDNKNVKIEGRAETTEQITRRNQSSELIKKVQTNMTLKEYEELLTQKRKASEAIKHAEEQSTLEKPDKSMSMDFLVKLFKRRDDHTVDGRREKQNGGQNEEFDIVQSAPFDINIQDPEQFPCLNVAIKT